LASRSDIVPAVAELLVLSKLAMETVLGCALLLARLL
jgi:hypothetical protein